MLQINDLSKTFYKGTVNENTIFNKFSFTANEGDFISIIGSNGAGKSTLLNLIGGSIIADEGSILLDGEEVINKKEHYRAKKIGRVFQNPFQGVCSNMTILENMSLAFNKGKSYNLTPGINKKNINRFKEQLEKIDLGLEDKINDKVGLLSGGQRQAISLLMAVMSKPKVLLLDEHTAALDPKTSEKIISITKELVEENKITTLMVTHNLNHAISSGNRLIMMHKGEVIVDIREKDKVDLTTEKLMKEFEHAHVKEALSDRSLLV
ncbi:ATP-binding cassette domain-containing protein [Clostridium bornimense]|uniref:ABC transporter ATP-binding protein n=1 Tax=Clostridium bornimense TaxID=1216932 RepID=UPI001C114589|nr:ATP-binding cassette domain-containing protein [Clostridium bornimense]MBU5316486.1 ATP-binding cassette domain-containing protein [Clostridium bornimense]